MGASGPSFEVLILGGVGTLLILINGVVDLAIAATAASVSAPIQFTNDAAAVGGISIFLAVVLGGFLLLYWVADEPSSLGGWGTLIAIVGAFSLWLGGGFLVGFILVFTAGVLAVVLANLPEIPSWLRWGPAGRRASAADDGSPAPSPPGGPAAPPTAEPVPPTGGTWMAHGHVVWFCRNCDHQNPTDSPKCLHCGTPRGTPPL